MYYGCPCFQPLSYLTSLTYILCFYNHSSFKIYAAERQFMKLAEFNNFLDIEKRRYFSYCYADKGFFVEHIMNKLFQSKNIFSQHFLKQRKPQECILRFPRDEYANKLLQIYRKSKEEFILTVIGIQIDRQIKHQTKPEIENSIWFTCLKRLLPKCLGDTHWANHNCTLKP